MKNMKTFVRLRSKKGSTLMTMYLLLVTLLILGSAITVLSINEQRSAVRTRDLAKAFQIAEAGIEKAIYELRQDFMGVSGDQNWNNCIYNGLDLTGPSSGCTETNYYAMYSNVTFGDGAYNVWLKNIPGIGRDIDVKAEGIVNGTSQFIEVSLKVKSLSPWDNAIFAGAGAAGAMINGNVDIRGSVHILGTGLTSADYAVDLGGTAELIGNNYSGLSGALLAKVPALPTVTYDGETVSTLNAELRVKNGIVGLSGSSSAGATHVTGNSVKETIDGSFVTHGFGGTQGTSAVHSDNGWSNGYDLGDSIDFPSLLDPYPGYSNYQNYLYNNAYVVLATDTAKITALSNIQPGSSFTYGDAKGSISVDGSGNMTIDGIVYIEGNLGLNKAGSDKTITYSGTGSILATGNVQVNVNLITSTGFPTNIMGIMTPQNIDMNEANIDVMGLFYAEGQVQVQKQTDIMGTIVSNYFNMGTNVPAIFQVPAVSNSLPPGMIAGTGVWVMKVVSWRKVGS